MNMFLFLISILFHLLVRNTSLFQQKENENYYFKYSAYPDGITKDWCPNGRETQGVANDGKNWFFTSTNYWNNNGFLVRIPAFLDLNQSVLDSAGVYVTSMSIISALAEKNYWHWGDPDHYQFEGVDYILVPAYGNGNNSAIVLFKADNLEFINYAIIDSIDIGWCAVDQKGNIYTSRNQANSLLKYQVNWSILVYSKKHDAINFDVAYKIYDENSNSLLLHNLQGGELTTTGNLLYIVCGSGKCFGAGAGIFSTDGIHVFDTKTWEEVRKSSNSERGETSYFDYSFNNGCNKCACYFGGAGSATPEGLTIWNLDSNNQAPNIKGQLHVLVNLFNKFSLCDDELFIHHFSNNQQIDLKTLNR